MIIENINGIEIKLEAEEYYFSRNSVDCGTMLMLKNSDITPNDKVLDLGCGYGVVGIYSAKICISEVVMSDILDEAIALSKNNVALNDVSNVSIIKSDGFERISNSHFTKIFSNPPYHTDFSVAKRFIEGSFEHLAIGGKLFMVTKRKEWYKNKIISIFGGVKIIEENNYYLFIAEKRSDEIKRQKHKNKENKHTLSKKLQKKMNKKKK